MTAGAVEFRHLPDVDPCWRQNRRGRARPARPGALQRGPLVGLMEEQLLDAVASLPLQPNGQPPVLSLRMEQP